jgi:hypothetical protein
MDPKFLELIKNHTVAPFIKISQSVPKYAIMG